MVHIFVYNEHSRDWHFISSVALEFWEKMKSEVQNDVDLNYIIW